MDPQLRQRMLAYYNERAPECEEAYTLGTGTASIPKLLQRLHDELVRRDCCSSRRTMVIADLLPRWARP